jgi:hypothetical protein
MRLIKLAAFALFGYALYEFFRGVLQDTQLGAQLGDAFNRATQGQGQQGGGGGGGGQGAFGGSGDTGRGMNISGPGEGERVSTLETDGGSVAHQVGRGVVS